MTTNLEVLQHKVHRKEKQIKKDDLGGEANLQKILEELEVFR